MFISCYTAIITTNLLYDNFKNCGMEGFILKILTLECLSFYFQSCSSISTIHIREKSFFSETGKIKFIVSAFEHKYLHHDKGPQTVKNMESAYLNVIFFFLLLAGRMLQKRAIQNIRKKNWYGRILNKMIKKNVVLRNDKIVIFKNKFA